MSKPKYDSSRDRRNYTFHPGRLFSLTWAEEPGTCRIYFLDERAAEMLRKMVAVFPKYQWIWGLPSPRSEWDLATQQKWEAISTFVEEVEASLVSGCDAEQINTQLDRIATALESIDQKSLERYSYQEFIDDLESAFGIGSIAATLVDSILGLMPNLKLKADFTQIAQGFVETWMRWKPLHAILTGIAASLTAIAGAQAASKILSLVQTIFQALDVVGNGWKDLILGDKNIYDGLLKPLWNLFISDSEGGTGGTDPDADPDFRIFTRITLDNDYTEAISDNIEAFRTTFETRSVAETVGQNTNFSDLIAALNTMNLTLEQQNELANAIEDVLGGTYEPT